MKLLVKRKTVEFCKKDKYSFRKGVSTTKSPSIKTLIPIKTDSWFNSKIGDGQLDTVVHCGDSLSEEMAYTLNPTIPRVLTRGQQVACGTS